MLIDVYSYEVQYSRLSVIPQITIWLRFEYKEEYVKILKDFGYNRNLNPSNGIVQLPLKLVIYEEEYDEKIEYFDTLVESLTSIIEEPAMAMLHSKSDDLRLESLSKFVLTCFNFENAENQSPKKIPTDFVLN